MEDLSKVKFNGEKLFKIRKKKRMSQETLAERVGVTRQTIYSWESNQRLPDVEKVGKICKVLNINLSDLVDGIVEQENSADILTEQKDIDKKKKNKKIIIKIILTLVTMLIITYIVISTMKFVRLSTIINKWKELNKLDSYYIELKETINASDKNEEIIYDKYYNNGIFKTVLKNVQNGELKTIIIDDYNNNYKYIVNEQNKTYSKRELNKNENKIKFTDNYEVPFDYSENSLINYLLCLNPYFSISYNKFYELKIKDQSKLYIEKDTGLLKYKEIIDKDYLKTKQYYEYELNTGKDFEINLDDYTEVTE